MKTSLIACCLALSACASVPQQEVPIAPETPPAAQVDDGEWWSKVLQVVIIGAAAALVIDHADDRSPPVKP